MDTRTAAHAASLSGRLLILLIAMAGLTPVAQSSEFVRGVNLAGGDFGNVPGDFGKDYTYPTEAEIEAYARRGFDVIRVLFRWERVQHSINGPLDTSDLQRLRQVVNWITERDIVVILDIHNYGGRKLNGSDVKLGSDALPASALADLWVRLSEVFKDNERVWFGLMNEPEGIPAPDWKDIAQSVTHAIRATGAGNVLLVPGTDYTGAHSWVSSGNAKAMESFVDPGNNFAFEVHQYLDADSSGKSGTCVEGSGSTRLKPFIDWAKAEPGRKGFLAEFAAGDPGLAGQEQCAVELDALLDAAENSGVFIGWTAWGGGAWWPAAYIFRLDPAEAGEANSRYLKMLTQRLR